MNLNVTAAESLNTAVAGVLARMTGGLVATFVAAALITAAGLVPLLFSGVVGWILVFAPLAMSLYLAWRGDTLSEEAIKYWFVAFSVVMGVSLSLLFYTFTTASIIQALVVTVCSFSALAAWGYFTRRDLGQWGGYLFAGVIALVVIGLFNIWFASTTLQLVLNVLTVLIFLALTAYDMNRIRSLFWAAPEDEIARMQWFGALSLYINFINIFVSILQIFGNRE